MKIWCQLSVRLTHRDPLNPGRQSHENEAMPSRHVALFLHSAFPTTAQSSMSVSHVEPLKPSKHSHTNAFHTSTHVPPLAHVDWLQTSSPWQPMMTSSVDSIMKTTSAVALVEFSANGRKTLLMVMASRQPLKAARPTKVEKLELEKLRTLPGTRLFGNTVCRSSTAMDVEPEVRLTRMWCQSPSFMETLEEKFVEMCSRLVWQESVPFSRKIPTDSLEFGESEMMAESAVRVRMPKDTMRKSLADAMVWFAEEEEEESEYRIFDETPLKVAFVTPDLNKARAYKQLIITMSLTLCCSGNQTDQWQLI